MIKPNTILRIARPTNNLSEITDMYKNGLGFKILSHFENHETFDGVILGHEHHPYHLEFTHHNKSVAGEAPTKDNLLVFYIPDKHEWKNACNQMVASGFTEVHSFNPYWDKNGKTFEDIDGYRVVLQNDSWNK